MRPFRFVGLAPTEATGPREVADFAKRAESIGFSALLLPDHLVPQFAPVPLLATVAAHTTTLRIGTFVFNNELRHPAVLAQDLATLDVLSEGRLEIGLGAGWNQPEFEAIGLPYLPVRTRVDRLTEAVAVFKGCFADGPFSFAGTHYTITNYEGWPKPAQKPYPPLFIGGGGRRVLTLAGREADIVGLAPRIGRDAGGDPVADPRSLTAAAVEEKISWVREAAGDRFPQLELNTYSTGGAVITDDARGEAEKRADRLRQGTGVELTVEEILDSPHIFIGSLDALTQKVVELRERFGISSIMFDDIDTYAPIVEALAGR